MNTGAINRAAINGKVSDLVVRVAISAKGYARIRANGRVLTHDLVHSTGRVQLQGAGGSVEAPLQADAVLQAAITGSLGHTYVRSLIHAKGRAVFDIRMPPLGARIASQPRASIRVGAGVEARTSVRVKAKAEPKVKQRVLKGLPVQSRGLARATVKVTVYALRLVRVPLEVRTRVLLGVSGSAEARLVALCNAQAQADVRVRALVRAPLQSVAVVMAAIDTNVYKNLPFDEPAPESRVFRVPAGVHTFYVVN